MYKNGYSTDTHIQNGYSTVPVRVTHTGTGTIHVRCACDYNVQSYVYVCVYRYMVVLGTRTCAAVHALYSTSTYYKIIK